MPAGQAGQDYPMVPWKNNENGESLGHGQMQDQTAGRAGWIDRGKHLTTAYGAQTSPASAGNGTTEIKVSQASSCPVTTEPS
jgi:hypothetical protein